MCQFFSRLSLTNLIILTSSVKSFPFLLASWRFHHVLSVFNCVKLTACLWGFMSLCHSRRFVWNISSPAVSLRKLGLMRKLVTVDCGLVFYPLCGDSDQCWSCRRERNTWHLCSWCSINHPALAFGSLLASGSSPSSQSGFVLDVPPKWEPCQENLWWSYLSRSRQRRVYTNEFICFLISNETRERPNRIPERGRTTTARCLS